MLSRLLKFPYANAKARALIAGYLGTEALEDLAGTSSRQRGVAFLKERRYLPSEEQAREVEIELRRNFISLGARVARSLPALERSLIETYLRRVDVENLKTVCRGLLSGVEPERFHALLVPAPEAAALPVETLGKIRDVEGLLSVLSHHPLGTVLREGFEMPPERRLHLWELALDRAFWAELRERLLELAPFDRQAAGEIIALRADVDRWQVVQRGWSAQLGVEEILAGLPPLGSLFSQSSVRRALLSNHPGDLLRQMFPVKGVADPFSPQGEVALFRRLYKQLRRTLIAPPFDIATPLAAVLLKEMEIRDLQAALSGLRLGRGPQNITPFFVSTAE